MAKKILAQIALAIMINLMIIPTVFGLPNPEGGPNPAAPASGLNDFATAFKDLVPPKSGNCINEFKVNEQTGEINQDKAGPDDGYVINISEEPLNVSPTKEETDKDPKPDYVVRRCFRNTFQYNDSTPGATNPNPTISMLAKTCSNFAQELFKKNKGNPYFVKYSCKEVQVTLTKGGTSAIYGYINTIYRWGASMVGIIAVTIIILSGIQISASGGDGEAINSAKKRILQSVIGIIVLLLSSLILYTVNPTFYTR